MPHYVICIHSSIQFFCPLVHSSEPSPGTCAGEIDPDTAIVPADVLSRQALDAQAEDLALEDTLYSLNKALQEGVISAEVYMKQVLSFLAVGLGPAGVRTPFLQNLQDRLSGFEGLYGGVSDISGGMDGFL